MPDQILKQHIVNPSQDLINKLVKIYQLGQISKAEKMSRKLLKKFPKSPVVISILGATLVSQEKFKHALHAYNKIIQLNPSHTETYFNRGIVFQKLKQFQNSIDSYDQAIKLNPDYPQAFNNRGYALQELGNLNQAIDSYNQAILLKPDYFEAYYNQGTALEDLRKIDEAIISYTKAIQTKKNDVEARWNLSLLLIMTEDLKNGWKEYEFGKLTDKKYRRSIQIPYTPWKGEKLSGKVILITAEQGIGDEIMFSSCFPDIITQNPKRIVVECDSRISALLENSFQSIQTIKRKNRSQAEWKEDAGSVDYQVSTGSLPKFFRQDMSQFPQKKSFLLPNKALVKKWKNRYALLGDGLKIGISWKGGNNDLQRSINLQDWTEIFKFKMHFVSLQYGDCMQEIKQLKKEKNVHIHSWNDADPLTDLDNFSAQISALDLVISVDNSTVHFAGAVGTTVYVLLPLLSNYRWMQYRDDSPWYPTMKLFRQVSHNNWNNVFYDIEKELKNKINSTQLITAI